MKHQHDSLGYAWVVTHTKMSWKQDKSLRGAKSVSGIGVPMGFTRRPWHNWDQCEALIGVNRTLTGQRYVDEILPTVEEWIQQHPGLLFQQDNTWPHTVRVSMQCLQQHNIPPLPWPAHSPDLSPIDHLWDVFGHWIRDDNDMNEEPAAILDQLALRFTDQWNQIPQAEKWDYQADKQHAKADPSLLTEAWWSQLLLMHAASQQQPKGSF